MMRSWPLRGNIFLAVVLLLMILAGVIMPATQRDVIHTAARGERQAVNNIIELIQHDVAARWNSQMADLMMDQRTTREQLLELSATVRALLQGFVDMAQGGTLSDRQAQAQALASVKALDVNPRRDVFIYDSRLKMLVSNHPDIDVQSLVTVDGSPRMQLASMMLEESRLRPQTVKTYARTGADGKKITRSASFQHLAPWDWVIVVSEESNDLAAQIAQHRQSLESSLRLSLEQIRLARSGFVFIIDDSGRAVTAPQRQPVLDALLSDPQRSIHRARQLAKDQTVGFSLDADGTRWQVQTAALRPLEWTLVAAVPQSDFTATASLSVNRLALIFAAALVLALCLAWLIVTHITRPLKTLTRYARDLPAEGLERVAPAPIAEQAKSHDEIGRLAGSFIFMQREVASNITRLMKESSRRERIDSELRIAHDIQHGFLPGPLAPEAAARLDLDATMQAAKEVGGDLYDYFMLPDGRLCFAIGDVSDKGVPAALLMAVTHTLIRVCAEDETEPARMLQHINARLTENNPKLMFVTLLLGVLDLDSGELRWANAGHPPPALISEHGVRLLRCRGGPACGVDPHARYRDFRLQLQPGATFFSYTDGVTDATDPKGEHFGEARLVRTLAANSGDCRRCIQVMADAVHRFMNGAEPFDDITLLALRRPGPSPD